MVSSMMSADTDVFLDETYMNQTRKKALGRNNCDLRVFFFCVFTHRRNKEYTL